MDYNTQQSADCIIEVLNEVDATVSGLEPADNKYLQNKYSYYAKNYFFSPKYKTGAWDGKISFYNWAGNTYTHLLPGIIEDIASMGYTIDLIDRRQGQLKKFEPVDASMFEHINHRDTGKPIKLAKHQVDGCNALLADNSGLMIAATGAGKVLCTAALVSRMQDAGLNVIIIVPSLDLISNTQDELLHLGLNCGQYNGLKKDIDNRDHVVSTWQSLKEMPILMKRFTAVIVDEAHQAKAQELKELLVEHGSHITYRYGMTGTMPKEECDKVTIHIALGDIKFEVSAADLIALGWLSTIDIEMISLVEDMREEYNEHKQEKRFGPPLTYEKFKSQYFPDFASEKKYLIRKDDRNEWIANFLANTRDNQGNTFVLVGSIDQGKLLAELIPDSVFVHGADSTKVRAAIYNSYKDADNVLVIATANIASTGINIPRIFNLVTIDQGKSFIRVIQSIGRGLRKSSDKNHLNVYDISSDLKYGSKHAKDRQKYYKEASYPFKRTKIDRVANKTKSPAAHNPAVVTTKEMWG